MKIISRMALIVAGLLIVVEVGLRLCGAVDFAVYHVDDEIGYIPEPNQAGTFLIDHSWAFNDRSMGTTEPWNPSRHPNILLIGNSIVMGGNPFDQKDKLGPLLQKDVGDAYSIWPIAAGGWTNVNEVFYLKRNPDIASRPNFFVWEYMSGGLSALATWQGDLVWPRSHPVWATLYVFRRYILPRLFHSAAPASELPPVGAVNPQFKREFADMVASLAHAGGTSHSGLLFLYPKKSELQAAKQGKDWLSERSDIEAIATANGLAVIDVAQQPEWNETLYRPDTVHPTVAGNIVLAKILADGISRTIH
jgi:hypothetical protein